ncbi:hypothetical protein [Hymenobacter crusticola]|uniref:hypothetical protein n=1 Tax=Hymenobacter crusticola TaxID=1770526 RepID=UPI0015C4F389|nr:hypothetical protein [Hymenobacter crusticola]
MKKQVHYPCGRLYVYEQVTTGEQVIERKYVLVDAGSVLYPYKCYQQHNGSYALRAGKPLPNRLLASAWQHHQRLFTNYCRGFSALTVVENTQVTMAQPTPTGSKVLYEALTKSISSGFRDGG